MYVYIYIPFLFLLCPSSQIMFYFFRVYHFPTGIIGKLDLFLIIGLSSFIFDEIFVYSKRDAARKYNQRRDTVDDA